MPSNLLILPLLAGYCFLHLLAFTKYRAQRLDGHRLIFESALVAIVLCTVGRVAAYWLLQIPQVANSWKAISPPVDYFGTGVLSIAAGVVIPLGLNWMGERFDRYKRVREFLGRFRVFSNRRALSTAMQRHGSGMHRLLYRALDEERQVAITLDNKKVYIGYVYSAPKLEAHDAYMALIPLLSGYREAATLELKLTQDYLSVFEGDGNIKKEDFVVVLPLGQIRMASFFEQAAYTKFEILAEAPIDAGEGPARKPQAPMA
jgi:hypothetical protein